MRTKYFKTLGQLSMQKISYLIIFLIIMQAYQTAGAQNKTANKPKVKLVLQLTVDQLRGDMIHKFESRFTDNGFKYLMNNGVVFTDAEYIHAITKTAPGHSTLATGTIPAIHGIVGNDWYDVKNEKMINNCEDQNYSIFYEDKSSGKSPRNLKVSTTADEISIATNGKAKVFGVSVKDRGAIYLAGFSGKAFWFTNKTGGFTSSTYYYNSLPQWVSEWNGLNKVDDFYDKGWKLLGNKASYIYTDEEYNKYEYSREGLGNNFPHTFNKLSKEKFYEYLPYTPYGDLLTLDFVEELISNEDIGKDNVVDYLSISFSCTDYIGHLFGPNSMEYEDQILNLDKVLSKLFTYIYQHVGLENTLITLSADHGVCESPEFLKDQKIPSGVLETDKLVEAANKFGRDSLKLNFDIIARNVPPYLYMDLKKLTRSDYKLKDIEEKLADLISNQPGVYKVYTSYQLENGLDQTDEINQCVLNSYYKGRSGQLYVVGDPGWYVAGTIEGRDNAASHGTPWTYDRFVPLLFGGADIKHKIVSDPVGPQDIAPTICDFLDIKPPSGTIGKSLLNYIK